MWSDERPRLVHRGMTSFNCGQKARFLGGRCVQGLVVVLEILKHINFLRIPLWHNELGLREAPSSITPLRTFALPTLHCLKNETTKQIQDFEIKSTGINLCPPPPPHPENVQNTKQQINMHLDKQGV